MFVSGPPGAGKTEVADLVEAALARAAACAEPVRRVARPIPEAPGVAYHRLTAEEHQWVFDELIVPERGPNHSS